MKTVLIAIAATVAFSAKADPDLLAGPRLGKGAPELVVATSSGVKDPDTLAGAKNCSMPPKTKDTASLDKNHQKINQPVNTELLVTVLSGLAVGFGFALTAGGGSILAVPILIYVLGLQPHTAVCVSMTTIAVLAWLAAVEKALRKEIDSHPAVVIALGGIVAAPFGVWLNRTISSRLLLILFALVAVPVGIRMFVAKTIHLNDFNAVASKKRFRMFSSGLLIGSVSGLLAGLLGLGGGFVIVPALVLIRGMKMRQAVSTSFLSIALIGSVATTLHLLTGQRIPLITTLLFIGGSIGGIAFGFTLDQKLRGAVLQKIFAIAVLIVALKILASNLKIIL